MTYQDVEPTFMISRDRGLWLVFVRYGTVDGQAETYEAAACFTPWGARRRGRREVRRIGRDRSDPLNILIARTQVLRSRVLTNEGDDALWAEYRQVLDELRCELDHRQATESRR